MYSEVLSKYLKDYAVYDIDTKAIAEFVKSHSTAPHFELKLASVSFHLDMEMNDMRSGDFKAVEMGNDGATTLPQIIEPIYKGKANDNASNVVSLTWIKQCLRAI